jgi:hypothetical protein
MNDAGLRQDGGVHHVTTKYHNRFGENMSKARGVTCNSHKI